jgi:hypothetical protein
MHSALDLLPVACFTLHPAVRIRAATLSHKSEKVRDRGYCLTAGAPEEHR